MYERIHFSRVAKMDECPRREQSHQWRGVWESRRMDIGALGCLALCELRTPPIFTFVRHIGERMTIMLKRFVAATPL